MSLNPLLVATLILVSSAFWLGKKKALAVAGQAGSPRLHSRPGYYGMIVALWCAIPSLLIFAAWQSCADTILTNLVMGSISAAGEALDPAQLRLRVSDLHNLVSGKVFSTDIDPLMQKAAQRYQAMERLSTMAMGVTILAAAIISGALVYTRIRPAMRARNQVEKIVELGLILCSTIAVVTTLGIVLSVLFEALRFFQQVPLTDFLFGTRWSPQIALRADQAGSSGSFGAIPVLAGTLMISAIAMSVAVPIGLMAAIYLSEYAGRRTRAMVKPLMEILAGVPTVVYGFFAALIVAPLLRKAGVSLGLSVSSESALAAGLVMGVMIIPFVSSLSDDVINAVPQSLREGSYGLGATKSETITSVILPAALPGIVGSILLAASRAIGETMIVVMAAGLSANLTANPLQAVTTVTVQIVTLLVGDQEFDSPKTLAAFALGLLLFVITLCLNVVALYVVRKYREEYE
ncbi:phosphate ABC transporter permease subunit PstC [Desulfogranum mediterraneum]|uniref:phosphate ABC transporter permease subunit PstC n=1 Tax=Desulfogranum mediterraneum TaxID=160661 RepID=UPI00040B587F|nr:phosphate ABC transporter permease subunit PstC [Desulfogranum mediterraneum]